MKVQTRWGCGGGGRAAPPVCDCIPNGFYCSNMLGAFAFFLDVF